MYDTVIKSKLAEEMKAQLGSMIDENMDAFMGDLEDKLVADAYNNESDKPCKFRISYSNVLSPYGDGLSVSTKVNWSVRKTDETEAKTVGYTEPVDEI